MLHTAERPPSESDSSHFHQFDIPLASSCSVRKISSAAHISLLYSAQLQHSAHALSIGLFALVQRYLLSPQDMISTPAQMCKIALGIWLSNAIHILIDPQKPSFHFRRGGCFTDGRWRRRISDWLCRCSARGPQLGQGL